ncbi:MAG: hypothetical protein LKF52_14975 [Butyrivibrio sp.]|jgi:hypothetical protein|nr:hypothetical protein [Butyrivibrio sp.]
MLKKLVAGITCLGRAIARLRIKYNDRMQKRYSASLLAIVCTFVCALATAVLLFIPPYIGVADDGSLSGIMNQAGLAYRQDDLAQETGAYFVRIYQQKETVHSGFSTQISWIRAAVKLDQFFTHDTYFDIRFLGLIYFLLYLPAVWLVIRGMALRVRFASEGTVIGVVSVLILGDGTLTAYFNSLYPEPVWILGMMYLTGIGLAFAEKSKIRDSVRMILMLIVGIILIMSEDHCAVCGIVLAVFFIVRMGRQMKDRILPVLCAALLMTVSLFSFQNGISRFNESSFMSAMTNGVLLESVNPADTLNELGIDPRYETLADMSPYDVYPYALPDNPEIRKGFLDHYSTSEIMLYYMRHPVALISLTDAGIKASFSLRRDYCGNYEKQAGMQPRAGNIVFTLWNNFKQRSAPETIGYLLLLAIVLMVMMTGARKGNTPAEESASVIQTFWILMGCCILHTVYIIIRSGTAEFARYSAIAGISIDLMSLLVFAVILHRLNIISTEGKDK